MKSIYIAPRGSDQNEGTQSNPLATLEAARNLSRKLIDQKTDEEIRILFKKGYYSMNKTVIFSEQDSREKSTTTIGAEPGAQVILSGGKALQGWTPCLELPEECPPPSNRTIMGS